MNFLSNAITQSTKELSDIFVGEDKLEKIIKRDDPVIISGDVWKRRGGIGGKLGSYDSAWEKRYIELRGSVLLYYESSGGSDQGNKTITGTRSSFSSSPKVPRGYIDLHEEKAATSATYGHSGAPTPFCISIKVGIAQETKWKLCFDLHETQMKWLVKISDVSIKSSVDDYNQALLAAANPNTRTESSQFLKSSSLLPIIPAPVYEPGNGNDSGTNRGQTQTHTLWTLGDYTITTKSLPKPVVETKVVETKPVPKASPMADNALHVMEKLLAQKEKARVVLEKSNNSLKDEVGKLTKTIQELEYAKFISESQSQKASTNSLKQKEIEEENNALKVQVEDLKTALQSKEVELTTTKSESQSKDDSIKSLKLAVDESSSLKVKIEEMSQSLQAKDGELGKITKACQSQEETITSLKKAVEENDLLNSKVAHLSKSLKEMTQSLQERNLELAKLTAEIQSKDESIGSLQKEIDENVTFKTKVEELTQSLQAKGIEQEKLTAELGAKEEVIKSLENVVEEKGVLDEKVKNLIKVEPKGDE